MFFHTRTQALPVFCHSDSINICHSLFWEALAKRKELMRKDEGKWWNHHPQRTKFWIQTRCTPAGSWCMTLYLIQIFYPHVFHYLDWLIVDPWLLCTFALHSYPAMMLAGYWSAGRVVAGHRLGCLLCFLVGLMSSRESLLWFCSWNKSSNHRREHKPWKKAAPQKEAWSTFCALFCTAGGHFVSFRNKRTLMLCQPGLRMRIIQFTYNWSVHCSVGAQIFSFISMLAQSTSGCFHFGDMMHRFGKSGSHGAWNRNSVLHVGTSVCTGRTGAFFFLYIHLTLQGLNWTLSFKTTAVDGRHNVDIEGLWATSWG